MERVGIAIKKLDRAVLKLDSLSALVPRYDFSILLLVLRLRALIL